MTTETIIEENTVETVVAETPKAKKAPKFTLTEDEQNGIIKVTGRINFNKLGAPQSSYNLLITSEHAKAVLDVLSKNDRLPFRASNESGEYYVTVTLSARSAMIARRGGGGMPSVIVTGTLNLGDVVNGRPTGFLEVTEARKLSFAEARAVTRTPRENITDGVEPATSGAGRSLRR